MVLVTAAVVLGAFVVFSFFIYIGIGAILSPFYSVKRSDTKQDKFRLVIVTIAAPHVRNALMSTIAHHLKKFSEYEIFVVIDEGAELGPELHDIDGIEVLTVPDSYTVEAEAKGRAINYVIDTIVDDAPDYWYGFIDDDNRILDDSFLYEIPYYDEQGYGAANPVIVPRQGRSRLTFIADHTRLVEDLTVFRLFIGHLKKPYLGLHGELLLVKGDILKEVTFNRETIVEDFAFAMELVRHEIPTWQSATRLSILSPHSIEAFLKQRRRWFLGIIYYLPESPRLTQVIVGARQFLISLSLTASWLFAPLWFVGGIVTVPDILLYGVFLGVISHLSVCLYGAYRIKGVSSLYLGLLAPFYAFLDQYVPLYSYLNFTRDFVVIEK